MIMIRILQSVSFTAESDHTINTSKWRLSVPKAKLAKHYVICCYIGRYWIRTFASCFIHFILTMFLFQKDICRKQFSVISCITSGRKNTQSIEQLRVHSDYNDQIRHLYIRLLRLRGTAISVIFPTTRVELEQWKKITKRGWFLLFFKFSKFTQVVSQGKNVLSKSIIFITHFNPQGTWGCCYRIRPALLTPELPPIFSDRPFSLRNLKQHLHWKRWDRTGYLHAYMSKCRIFFLTALDFKTMYSPTHSTSNHYVLFSSARSWSIV